MSRQYLSFRAIFAAPVILFVLSLIGLIVALLEDGLWDWLGAGASGHNLGRPGMGLDPSTAIETCRSTSSADGSPSRRTQADVLDVGGESDSVVRLIGSRALAGL